MKELMECRGPKTPPPLEQEQSNPDDDANEDMDIIEEGEIGTEIILPPDPTNAPSLTKYDNINEINGTYRYPPPPIVLTDHLVRALKLLIEHHHNHKKEIKRLENEYKVTCCLRSHVSIGHGSTGFVAEHVDVFNNADRKFEHSRMLDLKTYGTAKLVEINRQFKEFPRPMPMNSITLIKIASDYLKFDPITTMRIAIKLYERKYITKPYTFAQAYQSGFPNKEYCQAIIKQADEICGLRIDVKNVLGNFMCPETGIIVGNGFSSDQNAPIYPCIMNGGQALQGDEAALYKFICKYFLATCQRPACCAFTTMNFTIGPEKFEYKWNNIITRGFISLIPWMNPVEKNSNKVPEDLTTDVLTETGIIRDYKISNIKTMQVDIPKMGIRESEFIDLMEKSAIGTYMTIPDTLNALFEQKLIKVMEPRQIIPTSNAFEFIAEQESYQRKQLMETMPDNQTIATKHTEQNQNKIPAADVQDLSHHHSYSDEDEQQQEQDTHSPIRHYNSAGQKHVRFESRQQFKTILKRAQSSNARLNGRRRDEQSPSPEPIQRRRRINRSPSPDALHGMGRDRRAHRDEYVRHKDRIEKRRFYGNENYCNDEYVTTKNYRIPNLTSNKTRSKGKWMWVDENVQTLPLPPLNDSTAFKRTARPNMDYKNQWQQQEQQMSPSYGNKHTRKRVSMDNDENPDIPMRKQVYAIQHTDSYKSHATNVSPMKYNAAAFGVNKRPSPNDQHQQQHRNITQRPYQNGAEQNGCFATNIENCYAGSYLQRKNIGISKDGSYEAANSSIRSTPQQNGKFAQQHHVEKNFRSGSMRDLPWKGSSSSNDDSFTFFPR